MSCTDAVLTSIVANDEIHIRPKVERTEEVVTHEILEGDALNEADVTLETHRETLHMY